MPDISHFQLTLILKTLISYHRDIYLAIGLQCVESLWYWQRAPTHILSLSCAVHKTPDLPVLMFIAAFRGHMLL